MRADDGAMRPTFGDRTARVRFLAADPTCRCPLPHWFGGSRVRAPKPGCQTFGAHHTLRHRGSSACHADALSHPGIFPKKVDALSALVATGASPRAVTWHLRLLSGLAATADEG